MKINISLAITRLNLLQCFCYRIFLINFKQFQSNKYQNIFTSKGTIGMSTLQITREVRKCPSFLLKQARNPNKSMYLQPNEEPENRWSKSKSAASLSQQKNKGFPITIKNIQTKSQMDQKCSNSEINEQRYSVDNDGKQSKKSYENNLGEIYCIKIRGQQAGGKQTSNIFQCIQFRKEGTLKLPHKVKGLFKSPSTGTIYQTKNKQQSKSIKNYSCTQSQVQSQCASSNNSAIQDFEFIQMLGKGATAKVHLVQHKHTCTIYALKTINKTTLKDPVIRESIFRQIKNSWKVKDRNIVQLYAIFDDSTKIYLLMEYLGDGNLYDYWLSKKRTVEEKTVAKLIKDICQGLITLHENEMIHRDLKLENIMLQNGVAKICDLGCSIESKVMRKTIIGSPNYASPEQLCHHLYNNKVDCWAVGIMTFELVFGYSPYEKDIYEIMVVGDIKHTLPPFKFPDAPIVSDECKDFIRGLLKLDIRKRTSIKEAFQHPFLKSNIQGKVFANVC